MTTSSAATQLSAALEMFTSVDTFQIRPEATARYVEQTLSRDPITGHEHFTKPFDSPKELIHYETLLCLDNYQHLAVLRLIRGGAETTTYGIFVSHEDIFMTMEAEEVVTLLSTPSEDRFFIATVELAVKRAEELARRTKIADQMAHA